MKPTICSDCHHAPSIRCRPDAYGADCHCKCHDVADAGPELLSCLRACVEIEEQAAPASSSPLRERSREAMARAEGR